MLAAIALGLGLQARAASLGAEPENPAGEVTPTARAVAPLPVDYFMATPSYRLPKLALDGRSYSVVVVKDGMEALTTVDLATGQAKVVTHSNEMTFANYWWKTDSRLLLLMANRHGYREFQTFNVQTQRSEYQGRLLDGYVRLVNPLIDDPENVLVSTGNFTGVDLKKFNLRTGLAVPLHVNSINVLKWVVDQKGEPKVGMGVFHKRWFAVVPDGAGRTWRRIELGEKNPPELVAMVVATDQQHILALDYSGADTARVVTWDPATDRRETLWASAEVDPEYLGDAAGDWTAMNVIAYETDRPQLRYLDPADQLLARGIDAALPGATNTILSTTPDKSKMIIRRESDRLAGEFYLLDLKAKKLMKLGSKFSRNEPERMVASQYFTAKTAEGWPLHGRIYRPSGATGPVPTLLWVASLTERTRFGYNGARQLIASRGIAVVEIDHRGTGGHGEKFAEAGNLAVGGAMADDLITGLDYLAAAGLIDPGRVAILGEDQGGLLAMQALVRYPQRFAAWVNFATPMDLDKLDVDALVFGRFTEDEVKARFGSELNRRKYQQTLDPLKALPQITQPGFHYYPRNLAPNELVRDGNRLESYFARAGQPAVFIKGKMIRDEDEYLRNKDAEVSTELTQVYTELLAFLDTSLRMKH